MTAPFVIGAKLGLSGEPLAALRASGAFLIVDNPFELGARLLVDALRELPPERSQPYPAPPTLPKIANWQVWGMHSMRASRKKRR